MCSAIYLLKKLKLQGWVVHWASPWNVSPTAQAWNLSLRYCITLKINFINLLKVATSTLTPTHPQPYPPKFITLLSTGLNLTTCSRYMSADIEEEKPKQVCTKSFFTSFYKLGILCWSNIKHQRILQCNDLGLSKVHKKVRKIATKWQKCAKGFISHTLC